MSGAWTAVTVARDGPWTVIPPTVVSTFVEIAETAESVLADETGALIIIDDSIQVDPWTDVARPVTTARARMAEDSDVSFVDEAGLIFAIGFVESSEPWTRVR